ncbi:ABC transporter [Sphingobium sp. 22B]|uniref:ABC transporter ATP-binding protein n=1 Tax=unclassified Sphingobium TaxID=2611147 RepID=UPI000782338C|nr:MULTISPECIES: ABC transporter ATP-binding protein [unclassified Sphingobium]KXU31512.1 ABC transporter [Sphingobium sp. AM]KYC31166.1 ABC transporter [Sphingobium sp. 22B]OAP31167.1 ABC transporter [Sphingobium sp. 20006FA]
MYFESRLWAFTRGIRGRIVWTTGIGLLSVACGIGRLAMLGWLLAGLLGGKPIETLVRLILGIVAVMAARAALEQVRAMAAHRTAAMVQAKLRRTIFDKVAALGPGYAGMQRSATLTLALTESIDQLETWFGKFLPQFGLAILTPPLIFLTIAFIDLPVACTLLAFALLALFGPALWHALDQRNAQGLRQAYGAFAADFLDSVQGLATLKAFGQSKARGDRLAIRAQELCTRTMRVLATNVMVRGITDSMIALGAAAALAVGCWRIANGQMGLPELVVIVLLGTETFRPIRELRSALHQGMVGLSAAQGLYVLLDADPIVADAPAQALPTLAPTIDFDAVRFAYPGTSRTIHDGLDFHVQAGERIGIVGTSGVGKSSIVRLLMRFYDPVAGTIRIGGHDLRSLSFAQIRARIAVVSQEATPFHGTIAENIRFGRADASDADVEAAARAANIHDHILSLPMGYATTVGERGIKLSGGQRQRLAIARALLRDAPILVLDEALSAVDAENELVIQRALDRLMVGRTTLVLAHRLSSVIGCDRILVIHEGRVAEQGSHAALLAQDGLYARLMREQAEEAALAAPVHEAPAAGTAAPVVQGTALTRAPTEGVIAAKGLGWRALSATLLRMVAPFKLWLTGTILSGIARVFAFAGVGALSALVIRAMRNGEDPTPLLIALGIVALASGALHWLESWLAHDMAYRLLAQMRIAMYRKLDALAPAYLVRRRAGDLMALATADIELVEYFFAHTVAPGFVALLVPAVVIGVLATESLWVALTLLPFILAVGLSPFLMRERIDTLGSRVREATGELAAYAVECVQGLGEIAMFGREGERGDRIEALTRAHAAARLPYFASLTRQQGFQELVQGLGGLAVAVAGGVMAGKGAIDPGLLPLLTLLAMAAFLPISEIAQIGRQLSDTLGAARRIYALENEPVPVTDGPLSPAMRAAPTLALEQVGFTYPGARGRQLDDVSLTLSAGETLAIVGPSGAGKTTMAQLLLRFWDPDSGTIRLDGTDLRDFQLDALRSHSALVSQDTYLFNDTLEANIRLARPDASDEAVRAAVQDAALDDLVASLPAGLATMVGERGASLSGGQRQRVAIARALLKNAPFLILDEATSHLDGPSERRIRQAVGALRQRRTTIIIAHRLSTVRDADRIAVMERGRIVECGDHAALLAKGGLYARLVGRQMAAVSAAI